MDRIRGCPAQLTIQTAWSLVSEIILLLTLPMKNSLTFESPLRPTTIVPYCPSSAVRQMTAGHHQIVWDGLDRHGELVSTGMYLYRMEAVTEGTTLFADVKKMIFLK